jgi:hypothetical protein
MRYFLGSHACAMFLKDVRIFRIYLLVERDGNGFGCRRQNQAHIPWVDNKKDCAHIFGQQTWNSFGHNWIWGFASKGKLRKCKIATNSQQTNLFDHSVGRNWNLRLQLKTHSKIYLFGLNYFDLCCAVENAHVWLAGVLALIRRVHRWALKDKIPLVTIAL